MLCARESLFTNRTRVPGETVSCVVLTPADVIVMVVAELPPPPPPPTARTATRRRRRRGE